MGYRGKAVNPYGNFRRVGHARLLRGGRAKPNTVSKEEQDRRFRELSAEFAWLPPSSHRSIRQKLAMHKLYGETH